MTLTLFRICICCICRHLSSNLSLQIEQLGEKLSELETERAELTQYQEADRQRRALEFNIYDADLTDTRTQLEQVHTAAGLPVFHRMCRVLDEQGSHPGWCAC